MSSELIYRPGIDALRGVAVALVVAYHFFPEVASFGFLGVDIFFSISGFLITQRLIKRHLLQLGELKFFYLNRALRIFPALFYFLLISLLIGLVLLTPDELKLLSKEIVNASFFISNWSQKKGYFDSGASLNPLLHLWSLSIEIQFYLFYPLILIFLRRLGLPVFQIILILFLCSLGFAIFLATRHSLLSFYNTFGRVWEFMLGAFFSVLSIKSTSFWGRTPFSQILKNKGLIWVGSISYSLYLWHWFIYFLFKTELGPNISISLRLLAILISVLLAYLSYWLIEKPFRNRTNSKKGLEFLFSIQIMLLSCGLLTFSFNGFPGRMQFFGSSMSQAVQIQLQGTKWDYFTNNICRERYPYSEEKSSNWWFCMLSADAPPSILLLGSSYANHLYPGLASHPLLKHHVILSVGTCDPIGNFAKNPIHPCYGKKYELEQSFIHSIIEQSPSLRFVFLGGVQPPELLTDIYIQEMRKRLEFLSRNGFRIIVVLPHVRSNYNLGDCFSRPWRKPIRNCALDPKHIAFIRKPYKTLEQNLKKEFRNVYFFDPNEAFCNQPDCSFIKNGLPMYRDFSSHFSVFGSEQVTALLVTWAQKELSDLFK